jgi:transposase IS66 family protein
MPGSCPQKVNDALKLDPQDREVAAVLLLMGKLYAMEREAREAGAAHEQRLALRQQRSVALFEELQAKITQIASQPLPSSKLAEAANTPSTSGHG